MVQLFSTLWAIDDTCAVQHERVCLLKLWLLPLWMFDHWIETWLSRSLRLCSCQKPSEWAISCAVDPSPHPDASLMLLAPPCRPTGEEHPVPTLKDSQSSSEL